MLTLDCQVALEGDNPSNSFLPDNKQLETWVATALKAAQHPADSAELSLRIVEQDESQSLNYQYRGKDKPTNVLSFPADLPPELELPLLGDLVVCAPVVAREALEQKKTPEAHWAHMIVHGTLHLLGYDHIKEQEAETMEQLETDILAMMSYPAPYEQY